MVQLMETALRDAHQSLLATRMRTRDMTPIAEEMDKVGYFAIEAWGGATFDSCIRYLNEDPWERLRSIKEKLSRTPLQMLVRGQNLVGYKHYPDDIVTKFIEKSYENGVDNFRVFDALNDVRNMEQCIKVAKQQGAHDSSSNILGHNYRDAYLYLIQAYHFAGTPIGGYDYVNYYSPLIPFLTSLLFRLGFVSEASLFAVTGLFYPIAVIGIYFLLNLRFDKFYSMLGAILYGSMSINLMWTANGTLDIPSVALSIWAVYFFIKGLESNQKYFYLSFPLLVLSVFAKYTGALTILVMIVYLLSKRDIIGNFVKYIKNIIGGIITSFVFIIPFLSYYIINGLPFGFINQAREVSTETISSNTAAAPANDLFFYISSLPRFIYSPQKILGYFILLVAAVGVIYGIYKLINYLKEHYKDSANRLEISFYPKIRLNKNVCFIALAVSIIMIILTFLTAGMTSFIISELLLLIGLAIFASCFNSIFTLPFQAMYHHGLLIQATSM